MTTPDAAQAGAITGLARDHGIEVDPSTLRFNEAGLDYQVAFATADDDTDWVLRIPRRADVSAKVADEARILDFVKPVLSVAVPDWLVRTPDLIAYPLLPGRPGLTLDGTTGEPVWHVDRESPAYARSLGRLIAELHQLDADAAAAAGIPSQSAEELREEWRNRLAQVRAAFSVAPTLVDRWNAWLDDDGLWPEFSVFTHGELYPAHLLLAEDDTIASVLDWTTAKVADPAVEFMYHHMLSTPGTFRLTVDTYAEVTGRVPARLEERCTELLAAGPLTYAVYALTTGEAEHVEVASAQLNPPG